jgi:GTP-binding protein
MFVDQITIDCQAGDGGSGCLSFRREARVPRGGPDGGDGGHGGDVLIVADSNVSSLSAIVGHKHWRAGRGEHGMGSLMTGKRGEDVVIRVPPGTLVRDADRGFVLKDLDRDGDSLVVAKGGRGGHGNKHFATSTNRAPRQFERGEPGQTRRVVLELKLIADVGLIGMPNAGKSTLLSRLTRAQPEIADYPFTTKSPNLGLVRTGYDREFVMADIPGLIEGAHAGSGLGHEFLKHVERTKVLVHLVEPEPLDGSEPLDNYRTIRDELRLYDQALGERPEIVCVTKCELAEAEAAAAALEAHLGREVLRISSVTGQGLPRLVAAIFDELAAERTPR